MTDQKHSYSNFDETFRVQVGGTIYMVHQDIIAGNSKFFADKEVGSVDEQLIVIEDLEPAVFEAYISWLMFGELEFRDDDEDRGSEEVQRHFDRKRGIKLYLLGEFLGDVEFRVYVLDLFIRKIEEWMISADLIGMVWEVVTKESPLRRVVLQLRMAKVNQGLLNPDTVSGTVPEEFGEDVLSLTRNGDRMVNGSFPATVLRAMIEEHDDEYASPHSASVKETTSK